VQLNVRFRSILALIAASTLALGAAACGSDSDSSSATTTGSGSNAAGDVRGMGSTFAAPVYQQWGEDLDGQGITVNYQGVGSGAGIAGLANGTTTFAGSDPALTADDRAGPALRRKQLPIDGSPDFRTNPRSTKRPWREGVP
jgi:phosphate transport system substrate-binding protein